jgi:hypothetical protein
MPLQKINWITLKGLKIIFSAKAKTIQSCAGWISYKGRKIFEKQGRKLNEGALLWA